MCDICKGTTFDEYLERSGATIGRQGFTLLAVEGDPPWIRTIGLVESFDHPELLLADVPLDVAPDAMGELARRVVEGGRIEPEVDVFVDGVRLHVDAVGDVRCGRQSLGPGPGPEPPRRPNDVAARAPRGPNRVRRRQLRRRRHRHRSGHPEHGGT